MPVNRWHSIALPNKCLFSGQMHKRDATDPGVPRYGVLPLLDEVSGEPLRLLFIAKWFLHGFGQFPLEGGPLGLGKCPCLSFSPELWTSRQTDCQNHGRKEGVLNRNQE